MNTPNASNAAPPCMFCGSSAARADKPRGAAKRPEKRQHHELKLLAYAMAGDLAQVKALIEAGVSVNALSVVSNSPVYGRLGRNTALMFATAAGKQAVVEFLLTRGADPSLRNLSGETALSIALLNNHREIAVSLENAMKRWRSANDELWEDDRECA